MSDESSKAGLLFYSLLGSAKLAGVEPKAYLRAMAYAAIRGEELLLPQEYAREFSEKAKGSPKGLVKTGQGEKDGWRVRTFKQRLRPEPLRIGWAVAFSKVRRSTERWLLIVAAE